MTVSFPQGDLQRNLRRIEQAALRTAVRRGMHEFNLIVVRAAKQNLTDSGAVDRGLARNSIDSGIEESRRAITGIVFVGAEHGIWIELGRRGFRSTPPSVTDKDAARAAWPNIGAIRAWVQRNQNILAPSGRTSSGRAKSPTASDINSTAFVIARKIAMHGIEARPFMRPAFIAHRNRAAGIITKHIRQAARGSTTP